MLLNSNKEIKFILTVCVWFTSGYFRVNDKIRQTCTRLLSWQEFLLVKFKVWVKRMSDSVCFCLILFSVDVSGTSLYPYKPTCIFSSVVFRFLFRMTSILFFYSVAVQREILYFLLPCMYLTAVIHILHKKHELSALLLKIKYTKVVKLSSSLTTCNIKAPPAYKLIRPKSPTWEK